MRSLDDSTHRSWPDGYRLYLFNTSVNDGEVRFDAIWRTGAGGETQLYGLGTRDLWQAYDKAWTDTMRLEVLHTFVVSRFIGSRSG